MGTRRSGTLQIDRSITTSIMEETACNADLLPFKVLALFHIFLRSTGKQNIHTACKVAPVRKMVWNFKRSAAPEKTFFTSTNPSFH